MENLHLVHRPQAADSSHLKTNPSSKQLRDITTWDPESKAQSSPFWGADAYTDISHPGTEMPESSKNAHLAIQAHGS